MRNFAAKTGGLCIGSPGGGNTLCSVDCPVPSAAMVMIIMIRWDN